MSLGDQPSYGCDPQSDEKGICDCLGCSLDIIGQALQRIANILDERLGKVCDNIDQCTDKIIENINKRFKGPLYSCEQCKTMAKNGLAGTLEYGLRCANSCVSECDAICSLGDSTTEGQCCKTCGKSKCICKDGQCVPVDEPKKEDEHGYIGWCNPDTGVVAVTRDDKPPPGLGFISVSLTTTEQVAFEEAKQICGVKYFPITESQPGISTGRSGGTICLPGEYLAGNVSTFLNASGIAGQINEGEVRLRRAAARVGFDGVNIGNLGEVIFGAMQSYFGTNSIASQEFIPALASSLSCNTPAAIDSLKAIVAMSSVSQYVGFDISEWITPFRYQVNAVCRQKMLDQDKSIAAYLANTINYDTLNAYWAVQGLCKESMDDYVIAARAKPVPLQLSIMRRRQIIDSGTYHERMRQLGYLEPEVREQLFQITEQVPTMSDIIRLMVRDADDEQLATDLQMDSYFTEKYRAQLRKWSEAQGIPEKFAQYAWRAHWQIPSPTQLFEFYHRLRYNPEFNRNRPLLDDIKKALIQQDVLPYWHEHYLAVSFRPMRLRDIRRGYEIGSIDDADLEQLYIQLGYSDETSEKMAAYTRRLRDLGLPNNRNVKLWLKFAISRNEAYSRMTADGLPEDKVNQALDDASIDFAKSAYGTAYSRGHLTRDGFARVLNDHGVKLDMIQRIVELLSAKFSHHPAINDYLSGTSTENDARTVMTTDGLLPETIDSMITIADHTVHNAMVVNCQKGIKRRYLLGEITKAEALAELTATGTVNQRATLLVDAYDCERQSGGKDVAASKLCEWLARGVINGAEFTKRMEKIGYDRADAALMLDDCLTNISIKRLAREQQQIRRDTSDRLRISRLLARQAAQAEREQDRITRARQQAAATKARRDKQLLSVAEKLFKKCQCPLDAAINAAKSELSRVTASYALSIDESLQVLIQASDEFGGPDLGEFSAVVSAFADLLVKADLPGEPSESNGN